MLKLAIVTTHPIQYNAPFFKIIANSGKINLMVFYTCGNNEEKIDPGFGKKIKWDIPLLEGYPYMFVKNISEHPGSNRYKGIICPTLIKDIEAFAPQAILIYGWNFHAHLKVMRYFKGKIPVWFRGDSGLIDYDYKSLKELFNALRKFKPFIPILKSYLHFQIRTFYLNIIFKNIDKAFYVGANNKAYYLHHGLKNSQLVYMPHAVNNDFFNQDHSLWESEALNWRRLLKIDDKDFVVVFAGKFEIKKNPELLIEAIIELNKEKNSPFNGTYQLIMVGNGILEEKLKKRSSNKTYIHFLPFQNQTQMPIVYRLGDVFCLPSKGPGETWGLALNEAIACSRPVIASSKVGGAADLINKENGLIFDSGSKTALKDAIQKLQLKGLKPKTDEKFSIKNNLNILLREMYKSYSSKVENLEVQIS